MPGKQKLSLKHKIFVEFYCLDQNATNAAIRAGYSPQTAHVQGYRMLKNVKIIEEIEKRFEEHRLRCNITLDGLTDELEEARLSAMNNNKARAAVTAIMAKARLHGLLRGK